MAFIVHHGGGGTTAAALRSGVLSMAIPYATAKAVGERVRADDGVGRAVELIRKVLHDRMVQ